MKSFEIRGVQSFTKKRRTLLNWSVVTFVLMYQVIELDETQRETDQITTSSVILLSSLVPFIANWVRLIHIDFVFIFLPEVVQIFLKELVRERSSQRSSFFRIMASDHKVSN